jgi:hypothetical protein
MKFVSSSQFEEDDEIVCFAQKIQRKTRATSSSSSLLALSASKAGLS